jgi:hypothetical protein
MTVSMFRFGRYILLLAALSACSPSAEVAASKSSASNGSNSNGSNAAPIVGATPSPVTVTSGPYTAGQVYGSCLQKWNSSFAITDADANSTFPITSCATAGAPVCAAGFQLVYDTPTQMNSSSTPSGSSVVPNYRCMKNLDADANTNYVAGTQYGICLRKFNGAFQPTEVFVSGGNITNCSTAIATPVCPAGFKRTSDAPVQMNCSSNPSASVDNCYFVAERCVKL